MKPQIKALYITVKDMSRAVKFYEDIFGVKASSRGKRMSRFDFENFTFLLYDPSKDGGTVSFGENVVPCIEVKDLNEILQLVKSKGCRIGIQPKRVENYIYFQAKDTEGNIIEFYQWEG
jgi:predicted enzyme related to lactoylglutathione lyase